MQILKKTILPFLLFSLCVADATAQLDFRRVCAHRNGNDIELSWAQPNNPCGNFLSLSIYGRLNNLSPYSLIDSLTNINQLNYVHTNAKNLGSTWSYYLIFKYLCDNSEYNTDTLFIDNDQPIISTLDSVSYNPISGFWELGWSPNPAPDLLGYIVWNSIGNNNLPIDSLRPTYYMDSASTPLISAKSYTLSAYDSCYNQSVIPTNSQHTPIFLTLTPNKCGTTNLLTWNSYKGQNNVSYDIYVKNGDSAYRIENTIFPPETQYSFQLKSGDTVEYFIRVKLGNGATSRSNPVSIIATPRYSNDSNYITQVSWVSKNSFEIKSIHAIDEIWDSIYFRREFNKAKLLIYGQKINQANEQIIDLMPDTNQYFYTQILVDQCGRYYESNTHKNILLKSNVAQNDTYLLQWNTYANWINDVRDYQINLGDDISMYSTWNTIQTIYPDTNDQIVINDDQLNIRCFQIKATENGLNNYNIEGFSYSNPVCHIQDPSIYFPNAFAPHGINSSYAPVGLSIDKTRSTIEIYSRTGQRVWQSDLTKEWNGFDEKGNPYQDANFLYYAVIYFLNGEKQSYKGNITILY